jgi:hypothetical protein
VPALAVLLASLAVGSGGALAETSRLDGAWTLSPVTEKFTLQKWGGACGPTPSSGTANAGGPATVRSDGAELVIASGQRTLRTDECVDTMRTLKRESHTANSPTWRTRCATPPGDARHAVVNAAFFLTDDDSLSIAETGRYEFTIHGTHCVADVQRSASVHRVVAGPAPLASTSAAAGASSTKALTLSESRAPSGAPRTGKPDCSNPGEPARLEVRPSRKLLKLGDDFAFRAIVVDANGCRTATPIRWSLGPVRSKDSRGSVQPSIDSTGKVTVPALAPADAAFDVVATAAERSARAAVQVASPADFDALLAQSGLNSNGERDEPAVAILATASLGTTDVRAEDGARRRRSLFIAIIGSLSLVLGGFAVFGAYRARRARSVERAAQARHAEQMRDYERAKRDREERHAADMRAHLESVARAEKVAAEAAKQGPKLCPSCKREFASGGDFCPFDSNRLVPVAGHEALTAGPPGGVCPTCLRGFDPGVRTCPDHAEELVPPATLASRPVAPRGKICPTCGDRFEGTATFCGKDGTQLVLLN